MKDIELIKYDVLNAVKYALNADKLDKIKLVYYQKNLALDARYSFKMVNLLKYCDVIYIEYKGKKFLYKDNNVYLI